MNKYQIIAQKSAKLSQFLYDFGLKSSQIKQLFKNKDVKVANKRQSVDCQVFVGQEIVFFINEQVEATKKFDIIYEDENILIVNKHAGIEVVGSDGLEGKIQGAIAVHRIDKGTSGLVVMAKNKTSEQELLQAFKDKAITKKYICEVLGDTKFSGQIVENYLFKDSKKALVLIYDELKTGCKKIETKYKTIKHGNSTSVVDCELLTGRTHQIRAQLAHLGHPILGDDKYGNKEANKKFGEKTQKLFCYLIKFEKLSGTLNYLQNKQFKIMPSWFNKEI